MVNDFFCYFCQITNKDTKVEIIFNNKNVGFFFKKAEGKI